MKRIATDIPEVVLLEPKLFRDDRGWFCETYNESVLADLGITDKFVQDNESASCYGVVRGLHFQKGEHAQAKLVRVLAGEILDVAVDVRKGSPTFGKSVACRLSAENHLQIYVPKGFAHGFSVLSESAVVAYKCSALYAPSSEGSIAADDPKLAIDWMVPAEEQIRSPKDLRAGSFADYCAVPAFQYELGTGK